MSEIQPELVLMARVARRWPGGFIGRTQLMKAFYFLQVLRDVPLPYRFTLYSYGPFDSDVLFDLGVARNLGLIEERCDLFAGGYQYKIAAALDDGPLTELGGPDLERRTVDVDWVVQRFGGQTAGALELRATIVYADREAAADGQGASPDDLTNTVAGVKPNFSKDEIRSAIEELMGFGLLLSTG